MALYPEDKACSEMPRLQSVYRVIDDGDCILTTLDAHKALMALMELLDKYEVTSCWADREILK